MLFKYKHTALFCDNKSRDAKPKKNNPNRVKSFILLTLIFISTIIGLPVLNSSTVGATAITSASKGFSTPEAIDWQIKSLLYANTIQDCLLSSRLQDIAWANNKIDDTNAKAGKWFNTFSWPAAVFTTQVYDAGEYMSDVSGAEKDGSVWCDKPEFIMGALALWGLSPIEVLCNSDFYRVGDDHSMDTCLNGHASDGFTYNDGPTASALKFEAYMRTTIYNGRTDRVDLTNIYPEPTSTLSSPILFILYSKILSKSCIAGIADQPSNFDNNLTGEMNYNNVDWIDTTPSPAINKPGSYYGDKKQSENIQVGLYAYSQTQTTLQCSEIVAKRSKAVASYLNWYNTIYSQSPDFKKGNGNGAVDSPNVKSSCAIPGLGWILCPVLTLMSSLADDMLNLFNGFLVTSPSMVSNTSTTYKAWQIVRNIANIAFVIAFLIIIFSQITSVGITNYGIKKMLPKLIIAAILVNLSFYICQIAVDLSNIIGISIKGFLESSSLNPGGAVASGLWSGNNTWTNILGTVGVGVIGVAAVSMGALAFLIPALLSAIVALAMILFILIGRQAIIILLVIISPLAFVAYLLPNTEKLFKKWQTTLTSMLLLFPIVAFVAGVSKLAANILTPIFTANPDPTISLVGTIAANAVVVLPLFIIPGLLKKALDGVGSLGTKINAFGTKAGSALGKKGSKVYDNTALARGRVIREQAKSNYRNQKFAKALGKSGPRSFFARSHAPIKLGATKYANQQLQRTATAEAEKADNIAIANEQSILEANILSGATTADAAYYSAIGRNDSVAAKAALNVKFQTASGRTGAHALIKHAEAQAAAGKFKTENIQSLKRHISVAHSDMDSKDASLSDWGHNKTDITGAPIGLGTLESMSDTYKLTDTKLVGQSKNGLVEAYSAGSLDHVVAARILANGNITKDLKMPEREYLDRIVAAGGGTLAPPPLGVTDTGF